MSSVVHVDVAQNFEIVVDRVRKMADTTVDAGDHRRPAAAGIDQRPRCESVRLHPLPWGKAQRVARRLSGRQSPASSSTRPTRLAIRRFRKKMHSRTYLN